MALFNQKQAGIWIDIKTGQKYSGIKKNPYDILLSKKNTSFKSPKNKVEVIDVLNEIPESTVKVIKTIGSFAKSVQESIARSGASVGLTLAYPFSKKYTLAKEELGPELQNIFTILYGNDPLKSLQTRIAETEISLKSEGLNIPGIGSVDVKGKEMPLAVLGVGAVVGLDFTGWGGGKKQTLNLLAKTSKVDDVAKILKAIGVADDLVPIYSKTIAELSKVDDVIKVIDKIENIQKTTKIAGEIGKTTSKILKERQFLQNVSKARPDIPLKVGGHYIPRSTDNLAIKAKNLVLENIDEAEKLARTATNDKAVATASELIKHYSDEALKTTDDAIRNTLYDKAADIASITARNLTNQGRTIQAASIMGRLTPEGMLRFAAKEINKYNEAIDASKGLFGLKKKIPQLTKKQTKMILDEFKKIEKMTDGTEKSIAFKKLNDAILDFIPSSLYKKIVYIWKAGLLTGLKTSGLNTFSNLSHGVSETIKDVPASIVDSVASLFTGKRTMVFTTKGTSKGTFEGFKKGWRYLRTGFDERNTGFYEYVGVKLDWKRVNFGKSKIAKGIQKYEETIFHVLGAEDQPFYYGAKARSLMSQALAKAKNAKLKGAEAKEFVEKLIANPTDDMLRNAAIDAEIAVFQNETFLGKIGKALQNAPGGEFVVPFSRTPSAVANQLINYSPVGIVKTIVQNIGKGRFDQRLFSQAMGRGITGTGIMYLGTELFKKGMVSLSYPTGEREQKLWELEGRKQNSIKIGDKWRNPNVLGPAGFVLLTGAIYQEKLEETGSIIEALVGATSGGVKTLSEQTFLQGLNQVVTALDDPDRFFEGYFSNTIASIIPTIVGDLAKAFDNSERRTPGILDKFKAKIPGVRENLEPQINVLGEERQRGGNWAETMFDPTRPSKILTSDIIQEFRRLTDTGFPVSPTQLGDKEGYKTLTPEENTALWEKTGEIISSKLTNLFKSKIYQKASDEQKAKLVTSIIDKSKVVSRALAVIELTEDLSGQELKNKLSELKKDGLMTKEVFSIYLKLK
jgi:hypothetical protein